MSHCGAHDTNDKKCSICGEDYSQTERDEDYPKISQDMQLCPLCIEGSEGIVICQSCDNYFVESHGFEIEGRIICPKCKTGNTIECNSCGGLAINERLSHKRVIAGLCEDCETRQLYRKYIDELELEKATSHKVGFGQVKAMKTTNLMSRLHPKYKHTQITVEDSPFDVLLIDMWRFYRRGVLSYDFYLVVVHAIPSRLYSIAKGSCSMTEFKSSKIWLWNGINDERGKEKFTWSNGVVFTLWDCPYKLRAVTDFDMDFRKEYVYGELMYEGNNYGDTSDFYIIGSIAK